MLQQYLHKNNEHLTKEHFIVEYYQEQKKIFGKENYNYGFNKENICGLKDIRNGKKNVVREEKIGKESSFGI